MCVCVCVCVYAIVINNAAALQKKIKDGCELVHKMPGICVCVCDNP